MGNGTQANLNKLGVNIRKLSGLFFTHHHLDHNEEFVPIFIRSLLGKINFIVAGPPNTKKLTLSNLNLYEEDISYRLSKSKRTFSSRKNSFINKELKGGETFFINNIKISTLKVPHSIYTIAYKFEYNNKKIIITGDLTYSSELSTFAKNSDFMIIDSGGMIMSTGKKNKRNSKKKSKKSSKQRANLNLVYTHFRKGSVNEKESLEETRKNFKNSMIFAKDLLEIK